MHYYNSKFLMPHIKDQPSREIGRKRCNYNYIFLIVFSYIKKDNLQRTGLSRGS